MTDTAALKAHLVEQARANRWINQQWWLALAGRTVSALDEPQGAFFGSIWGTWNHILLTDKSWLGRITGKPFAFAKLSDRPWPTLEAFAPERAATDEALVRAVAGLPDVGAALVYRNTSGKEFSTPLHQVLQHLFLHEAHHRAQIHQMCGERKIALPDGGLIGWYRGGPGSETPALNGGDTAALHAALLDQATANRWINQEWWKALRDVPLADLDKPQGAFWGSIFATWNHILLGTRIWLGRIAGKPIAVKSLGDRLTHTVEAFLAERDKTDAALIECVANVGDVRRPLEYRGNQNQPFVTPLHRVLQHVLAHEHHHRGQIHQMCSERGIALPDGGLIAWYRR